GEDGISGGYDDYSAYSRRKGRQADRHRRHPGDSRKHGRARGERSGPAGFDPMVEAVSPTLRFEMTGISKSFGATAALKDVTLKAAAGEVCALVGQNGAGKSTLMNILSGAAPPDAGTMTLDGVPYHPRNPLEARRSGVAMIYQELSLAPDLS